MKMESVIIFMCTLSFVASSTMLVPVWNSDVSTLGTTAYYWASIQPGNLVSVASNMNCYIGGAAVTTLAPTVSLIPHI